jgi:putative PIN family toxin of toxin-antitoxin system
MSALAMVRVVFDTVVFVRGLINPRGRWGRLLFDEADRYHLILSPAIIKEIVEVIHRPALTRRFRPLTGDEVERILAVLTRATIVEPAAIPAVSPDAKDDIFLATARAGGADYLVSADKDLLVLGDYEGITIITAQALLDLLEQPDTGGT